VWVDSDRMRAGCDQHGESAKAIGPHFRTGERHGDGQMVEIGRAANDILQHVGPEVAAHVEVYVVLAKDGIGQLVDQLLRQTAGFGRGRVERSPDFGSCQRDQVSRAVFAEIIGSLAMSVPRRTLVTRNRRSIGSMAASGIIGSTTVGV
jgi:hypothetical protein